MMSHHYGALFTSQKREHQSICLLLQKPWVMHTELGCVVSKHLWVTSLPVDSANKKSGDAHKHTQGLPSGKTLKEVACICSCLRYRSTSQYTKILIDVLLLLTTNILYPQGIGWNLVKKAVSPDFCCCEKNLNLHYGCQQYHKTNS